MSASHESVKAVLEHMLKRPGMYFSPDVPTIVNYLDGFALACRLLEPSLAFDQHIKQVALSRGWEDSSRSLWRQMQDRRFDDDATIAEMLTIYNLAWEKIVNQDKVEDR